jgi:hypothetical protein
MLFVHVPKTAGTSLRLAFQQVLGAENCYYDYGPAEKQTSECVKDLIYAQADRYALAQRVDLNATSSLLAGHFPVAKYLPLMDPRRVLTFVRDPYQQVMSHYLHFQRHHRFKDSFEAFVQNPLYQNVQSTYLKGLPLAAYGFLGVVEDMDNSLGLLKQVCGLDIGLAKTNRNPGKSEEAYALGDGERDMIKAVNKKDMDLYRRARHLLAQKSSFLNQGKPWVYGTASRNKQGLVSGWAYYPDSDAAVELVLEAAGGQSIACRACALSAEMALRNGSRRGYVGFQMDLSAAAGAGKSSSSPVLVRVAATGQVLARVV